MENEIIETRTAKIWLGEDSIFRLIYSPKVEVKLDDAREITAAQYKLLKGKKLPLLADTREMKSIDREARQHFKSEEIPKTTSAVALLVSSPVSRVIGSFFLGINKPLHPVKLFTSEAEAIKWLKEFIG